MEQFLNANLGWIFDGIGVIILGWIVFAIRNYLILYFDGEKVYKWLKANTRDEPHESHKTLLEIITGTRLPEERVKNACLKNKKIFHSLSDQGTYSTWRQEPQSVYEKRGFLKL